ncbi:hypothetical protein GWI33_011180 [Rhynchophorus ferrugineus]
MSTEDGERSGRPKE